MGVDGGGRRRFPFGVVAIPRSVLRPVRRKLKHLLRRIPLTRVVRAFDATRRDLHAVGLLDKGRYLDHIRCEQTLLPAWEKDLGYVYDEEVGVWSKLRGHRAGVIYLPPNAPVRTNVPGGTLRDTLRHEFGHAWAWYDRDFFERPWFHRAFGAGYFDAWEPPPFDRDAFVSEYACTLPKEDFAETFMVYLRMRRSLSRYAKRPGLYAKLLAVEKAVALAARTRLNRPPPRR